KRAAAEPSDRVRRDASALPGVEFARTRDRHADECHPANPAFVADERCFRAGKQVEPLDGLVFGRSEHKAARRVEATADERPGMFEFAFEPRGGEVGAGGWSDEGDHDEVVS